MPRPSRPPDAERHLRRSWSDRSAVRRNLRAADKQMAGLASEQWGVVSLEDLRLCGLSRSAVNVRVRNGRLHPLHLGVYAVGHPNPPLQGRLLAAMKACGARAVLSHYSAAVLWNLVDWDERRPEVTVVGATTRRHRGLRVHRTNSLAIRDVARHGAIRMTSPVRTLVDLAGTLEHRPLRRAVRQAQSLRLVSVHSLVEASRSFRGRRGIRKLRTILASGPAPTRSELEDIVLDLILRAGLAHPSVNAPLTLGGRRVVPDFRWPEQRLVVEADGAVWHDNPTARADDAERQALLEAAGERVRSHHLAAGDSEARRDARPPPGGRGSADRTRPNGT